MIEPKQVDINIRENLKIFFLEEVIGGCEKLKDGPNMKNSILILDHKTTKVLDKFLGVIDLIEWGIIGIENLYKKRKSFKQFHAVYFIEPSEESIDLILKDFAEDRPDEKDENGKLVSPGGPLYDFAHIIVSGTLGESYLQSLSSCKPLVYALLSIRQVNMDIFPIDENVFELKIQDEAKLLNKNVTEKEFKFFQDLTNQSLSIFTLLRKVEHVQMIYEMGGASEIFAKAFEKKMNFLVNNVSRIGRVEIPPVYFFVINRGSDLLSLFARDNSYSSLYFNILRKSESKIEYEVENSDGYPVKQTASLNEHDPIWLNYKYTSFNEAKNQVSKHLKAFLQSNTKSKKKETAPDDLARSLPQYQEFIKDFSKHINAMKSITTKMNEKKFSVIYEYEQGILTGKKKNGDSFTFTSIKKSEISEPEERIRLALIAYFSGQTQDSCTKVILDGMEEIATFKTIVNVYEKAKINATDSLAIDDMIEPNGTQYFKPKVSDYLLSLISGKFWENPKMKERFGKMNIAPKSAVGASPFEKNLFKQNPMFQSNDQSPIVIFFFLGGVSHTEIRALNTIATQKEMADFRILVGGTSVSTSYSLMKKYWNIEEEENQVVKEKKQDVVNIEQ